MTLRHNKVLLIPLLLGFLSATGGNSRAWEREGHEVVVRLALRLMDSVDRAKVYDLLDTTDAKYIGNWADVYGKDKEHKPWHYVNIPVDATRYKAAFCGEACVVSQLEWAKAYIHDHRHSKESRKEALLWWFHLVGDLHQPFHCYDNDDSGGGKPDLDFNGHTTSLHRLWDDGMLHAMQPNVDSLANIIYVEYHESPAPSVSFVKAANLSHKRAVEAADVPDHRVTKKYVEQEWPIVMQSLWEAACMAAEIAPNL